MGLISFIMGKSKKRKGKGTPRFSQEDSEPITRRMPEIEPEPITKRFSDLDSALMALESVRLKDPYSEPIE